MNIEIWVNKINKRDFSSGKLIPKRKITYRLNFVIHGDEHVYKSESFETIEELSNRLIKEPLFEDKMFPIDLLWIDEFIKYEFSIKFKC